MEHDYKGGFERVWAEIPKDEITETLHSAFRVVAMAAYYQGLDDGLKRAASIMGGDNDQ